MTGNIQHMDQATYLRGFSLWESLFEFGPSALIDELSVSNNLSKPEPPQNTNAPMVVQLFGILAGSLQELKNHNTRRDEIIKSLKHDILNQIKMGDLIPFGFKEPRDISDRPIQIPADLLFSGVLNWEKGELKYKNYEFKVEEILSSTSNLENGRKNELEKALTDALKSLFARIERGLTIEIKVIAHKPLEGDNIADTNEENAENSISVSIQSLEKIQAQLKFPEPSTNPILSIPTLPSEGK